MYLEPQKMNRRVFDFPDVPKRDNSPRDRGARRSRAERTTLWITWLLRFMLVMYCILCLRLYLLDEHVDDTKLASRGTPKSLFTLDETFSERVTEPARVEHIPARSDTGLFVTMGSYVMDGDASSTTHPSLGTDDLILVVIGVGDFTKRPQPSSDKMSKRPPAIPSGLSCVLTHSKTRETYRFNEVNFHSNGTAYEGKISPSRGVLYFGERAVWISCPVPRDLSKLRERLVRDTSSFELRLIIETPGEGEIFDSNPTTPSLVLSTSYERPLRNLTLCTSAIYGLTSTKWIIEYLEYHRAAGFDSMDLYVHSVGDLVRKVLDEYVNHNSDKFFVRLHDWTRMIDNGPIGFNDGSGVGKGVQSEAWEHGQRLTRNDCFLRNRGRSRWIMFCDVDELFVSTMSTSNVYTGPISQVCESTYQSDQTMVGCSFSSVTTPPNAKSTDGNVLLLERIDISEAKCQVPYNCGRFHHGREKYAVRTQRGSINPNGPFFYHAISQNYEVSGKHHHLVPSSMGYVRHYAGHFAHSRDGGLPPHKAKYNPLPADIIQQMRQVIYVQDGFQKELYIVPNQNEKFLKLFDITNFWRFSKTTPPPSQAPALNEEKYMTFEYYNGRLNNQLWTLDWVFRTALALNRTAIIGSPVSREQYIGFPIALGGGSLWDIEYLRKAPFSFKFEWEIKDDALRTLLFGDHQTSLPPECVWEFSESRKHIVRWAYNAKCTHQRFHFVSNNGLIHPYKADTRSYGVDPLIYWRYMRVHPDVASIAHKWWRQTAKGSMASAVALHYRSWREANGDEKHALKVCSRLSAKLKTNAAKHFQVKCGDECDRKVGHVDVNRFWQENLLDFACPPSTEERIRMLMKGVLDGYKGDFFVATDHEAADVDDVLHNLGAIMMSEMDVTGLMEKFSDRIIGGVNPRKLAESLLPILLDTYVLVEAGRFYGSAASTLSQAVCLWRRALKKQEEPTGMCPVVWFSTFSDRCDELCY